jgi:hypothetical protein
VTYSMRIKELDGKILCEKRLKSIENIEKFLN